MPKRYQFRVHRHPTTNKFISRDASYTQAQRKNNARSINHPLHFCLTLMSFGLWGIIWWRLILTSKGEKSFISALDDDYWSYLIEREQPPAALYPLQVGRKKNDIIFEA
ncbi:hypothetical protein [Shewanella gaetbuli]|uniref:Uncharacterized protein n=1 Tax=Shewanella gaetbuli TaxID=220752 RepID=A0A9X2CIL7_9GAMM|nr:hypothetical protein [Shewanella gaetbuli]MCL1141166.1 hypothetical protein [Shewanella gaetbuli]